MFDAVEINIVSSAYANRYSVLPYAFFTGKRIRQFPFQILVASYYKTRVVAIAKRSRTNLIEHNSA